MASLASSSASACRTLLRASFSSSLAPRGFATVNNGVSTTSRVLRATLATAVVAPCVGAGYLYATEPAFPEQVYRTAYFWSSMFPIYGRYRFTQWRVSSLPEDAQDAAYEELHDRYAERVVNIALELKGLYIKLGQVGASRGDFVPKQYMERLSELQDRVPARDGAFARRMVEEAFGRPVDEIFASFDDAALGAASIGQVHRATLKDGREVVVKIQYPDVQRLFGLDLANARLFARVAQPEYVPMIDEMERQIKTEFDFAREAEMLQRIGDNIRPHFGREVFVPRPIEGLVSERVFVMERVPGIKLVDGIKELFGDIARAQGVSLAELKEQALRDPPTAAQLRLFKWQAWATTTLANTQAALYNGLVAPFTGRRAEYRRPLQFIDERRVLDTLLRVHAHQIFRDGVFNGDPHAGNVILMPDGRLGLIDYGQVKEIDEGTRADLARLVVLLAQGESAKDEVVTHFVRMGLRTKRMDPWVIYKNALIYFDRCDRETTEGMNLQLFLDHLTATDPTVEFPEQTLFAARVSLLIRGLGTVLGHPVTTAKVWLPYAQQVLAKHPADDRVSASAQATA